MTEPRRSIQTSAKRAASKSLCRRQGTSEGTVYFDKDGNFRLFTGHPSLSDTLTSPYASIETSDRGLDKTTVNPDGTVLIFGTGIHLRVKGQVYAIGLWRLTIDPETGELIDQEYHGRFDVLQPEIIEAICSLLGPEGAQPLAPL